MIHWVTGPTPLTERKFNVTVGEYVVLLVNGRPHPIVFTAGRNGGAFNAFDVERRVPLLGDLSMLVFSSVVAIDVERSVKVRLADGAQIEVTATLEVTPAWISKTSMLLDYVHRYGAHPETIIRNAEDALAADYEEIVRASLAGLTYVQVHSAAEPRGLLNATREPSGLLEIHSLVRVTYGEDAHASKAMDLERELLVTKAQIEHDVEALKFGRDLELTRLDFEIELKALRRIGENEDERTRRVAEAKLFKELARMLDMEVTDIADPESARRMREIKAETVRDLLTKNPDILPLLASMDGGGNPSQVIADAFRIIDPRARAGSQRSLAGHTSWPRDSGGVSALISAGLTDIQGAYVLVHDSGNRIAAVAVADQTHVLGSGAKPGAVIAIVVPDGGDRMTTMVDLLNAAGRWCGSELKITTEIIGGPDEPELHARVDNVTGGDGPDSAYALALWVAAINGLLEQAMPRSYVSIGGIR